MEPFARRVIRALNVFIILIFSILASILLFIFLINLAPPVFTIVTFGILIFVRFMVPTGLALIYFGVSVGIATDKVLQFFEIVEEGDYSDFVEDLSEVDKKTLGTMGAWLLPLVMRGKLKESEKKRRARAIGNLSLRIFKWRLVVTRCITVIILVSAISMILIQNTGEPEEKWVYSSLGAILGFWLGFPEQKK